MYRTEIINCNKNKYATDKGHNHVTNNNSGGNDDEDNNNNIVITIANNDTNTHQMKITDHTTIKYANNKNGLCNPNLERNISKA